MCDFCLNVGFRTRKLVVFWVNWGICEEKTRDFRLNVGFAKRKRDFQVKWEISEEKTRDFRLNGEFEKRKFVIFT